MASGKHKSLWDRWYEASTAAGYFGTIVLLLFYAYKAGALGLSELQFGDLPHVVRFFFAAVVVVFVWSYATGVLLAARDRKTQKVDWVDWAFLFGSMAVLARGLDALFTLIVGALPSVA